MFDEHPARLPGKRADGLLPLFYRKKTGANGESDEISLGPSVVCIFKWMVGVIVASLFMLRGADSSVFVRLLLRLWP
jgi:hypothetical protein